MNALKIINTLLMLFALYMGLKQGSAMLTGKPEMLGMFSKWNFSKNAVMLFGIFTILGALLMLFPKTFLLGNFITAAGILLIIIFHLHNNDIKGVFIELPFLLLSLVIIYLQHPLTNPAV